MTITSNELRKALEKLAPKNGGGFALADAPITKFSMGSFITNSYVPKDKDGNDIERQYSASTTFTIIFRDFIKLGEATSILFRMPHVKISSTSWTLTDATRESLGSESRKAAMHDAMAKAKDYADVLGKVAVAVDVQDCSYSSSYSGPSQELGGMSRTDVQSSKVQVDGLALEPENIEIHRSMDVKFEAT